MLTLNYPGRIPSADIVGRLMGPDTLGGYLRANAVEHVTDVLAGVTRTVVHFLPVAPGETQGWRDGFGQWWLASGEPLSEPSPETRHR